MVRSVYLYEIYSESSRLMQLSPKPMEVALNVIEILRASVSHVRISILFW
jgi:hypothetical protein